MSLADVTANSNAVTPGSAPSKQSAGSPRSIEPPAHAEDSVSTILSWVGSAYRVARSMTATAQSAERAVEAAVRRSIEGRLSTPVQVPRLAGLDLRMHFYFELARALESECGSRAEHRSPDPAVGIDPGTECEAATGCETDGIVHFIRLLPPDERLPLLLKSVEEFSYEQLARILDCPVSDARDRLHCARATIRDSMRRAVLKRC